MIINENNSCFLEKLRYRLLPISKLSGSCARRCVKLLCKLRFQRANDVETYLYLYFFFINFKSILWILTQTGYRYQLPLCSHWPSKTCFKFNAKKALLNLPLYRITKLQTAFCEFFLYFLSKFHSHNWDIKIGKKMIFKKQLIGRMSNLFFFYS